MRDLDGRVKLYLSHLLSHFFSVSHTYTLALYFSLWQTLFFCLSVSWCLSLTHSLSSLGPVSSFFLPLSLTVAETSNVCFVSDCSAAYFPTVDEILDVIACSFRLNLFSVNKCLSKTNYIQRICRQTCVWPHAKPLAYLVFVRDWRRQVMAAPSVIPPHPQWTSC